MTAPMVLSGCGACTCTGCAYCIREWFTDEACDCRDVLDGCVYCGCPGCGDCIDDQIGPCGCHTPKAADSPTRPHGTPGAINKT